MSDKIKVGITSGDPNGIGYEVILKALANDMMCDLCTPVVFANPKLIQKCRRDLHIDNFNYHVIPNSGEIIGGKVNIVDLNYGEAEITPGVATTEGGKSAIASLMAACDALRNGDIDVIVTSPICKQTTNSEEFPFPGHTEFFGAQFGHDGDSGLMILFNDNIRVALVTTHLPISKVSESITRERIGEVIEKFNYSLIKDFNIQKPTIAVLSLNPHCGDGGLLGNEETETIIPAIAECRQKEILAFGPFAADGFFAAGLFNEFDGVVAMYHDQGLAPFKTIASQSGVNFTAGLDIVRTSPDHGTAFDIAWKGVADPQSMREAIYKAIDIFRNRRNS